MADVCSYVSTDDWSSSELPCLKERRVQHSTPVSLRSLQSPDQQSNTAQRSATISLIPEIPSPTWTEPVEDHSRQEIIATSFEHLGQSSKTLVHRVDRLEHPLLDAKSQLANRKKPNGLKNDTSITGGRHTIQGIMSKTRSFGPTHWRTCLYQVISFLSI